MNGILIINKPKDCTSRDVVNKIVKILGTKKVGHTGTLDPIATGVLVVCVGNATKLVDYLTCNDKEYVATVELGTLTDTLDNAGNILKDEICIKTKKEITNVLNSMKGFYDQEVPIYSAVKINGKKLYEYARENIEVKLPKRNVEIKDIELISDVEYINNKTIFKFKCSVSKGTYIRSLIRDIAHKLNTIGIMTDLIRTKQGKFNIEDSINIEDVCIDNLISIKDVLEVKTVEITPSIEKQVMNGATIDAFDDSYEILFMKKGIEIALYIKAEDKLKPYKMFKGGII